MPGLDMDEHVDGGMDENTRDCSTYKESLLSTQMPQSDSVDLTIHGVVNNSIEQLCHNVCEIESSDLSPSRRSFGSYGEESRIDSELNHLVGDFGEVEKTKEVIVEEQKQDNSQAEIAKNISQVPLDVEALVKSSPKIKSSHKRPPTNKRHEKNLRKPQAVFPLKKHRNLAFQNGIEECQDEGSDNPDLGPSLLQQTRAMISSGENPQKALDLALRALKSFEKHSNDKPNLELVMCLHVLGAIYCSLGQYNGAVPVLERSIDIPMIEDGQIHALAKFAGCMQLGDTYAMMGQIENSLLFYTAGLEIQRQVLGEIDPRVGETCRYVAEAYVQALEFDEAKKLCQMALDIHSENSFASLEEAADRRLMGLICDAKGDHEAALEHYVLASTAMASSTQQEIHVASIERSIGDVYLSLSRYDEAVFAYQKALNVIKSAKGENHPAVASVFVRLADLYNKIGKFKESKSYCENALQIYEKPNPGTPSEEIAGGFINVSALYQSMNELEPALKLLKKALKIYGNALCQHSTVAGIEAQMGVMYYMMGNYSDSYNTLKNAISKFRASGEKKSALFGIALNQMGLACVQRYEINEAANLFEEARTILEKEYGPYHRDTLGVYSNLAGTYDAMGRLNDAIEILEHVVGMREEKLGTANPEVDDEKRRLAELLKEAGRVRNKKGRSLETLLDTNSHSIKDDGIKVL